jgi:hypothetical protein
MNPKRYHDVPDYGRQKLQGADHCILRMVISLEETCYLSSENLLRQWVFVSGVIVKSSRRRRHPGRPPQNPAKRPSVAPSRQAVPFTSVRLLQAKAPERRPWRILRALLPAAQQVGVVARRLVRNNHPGRDSFFTARSVLCFSLPGDRVSIVFFARSDRVLYVERP